jgi:hypothetical protein
MAKFKGGDKIICIGAGWKQGRTGYIESVQEGGDESLPVYSVYFPDVNRKIYVTESELTLDERIDVAPNEVLIFNADEINADVASEACQRLGKVGLLVRGGKKNIEKMNHADLKTVVDKMNAPAVDPVKPKK